MSGLVLAENDSGMLHLAIRASHLDQIFQLLVQAHALHLFVVGVTMGWSLRRAGPNTRFRQCIIATCSWNMRELVLKLWNARTRSLRAIALATETSRTLEVPVSGLHRHRKNLNRTFDRSRIHSYIVLRLQLGNRLSGQHLCKSDPRPCCVML